MGLLMSITLSTLTFFQPWLISRRNFSCILQQPFKTPVHLSRSTQASSDAVIARLHSSSQGACRLANDDIKQCLWHALEVATTLF